MVETDDPTDPEYQRKPEEQYVEEDDRHECKRCGYVFDPSEQDTDSILQCSTPRCPWCEELVTSLCADVELVRIALEMKEYLPGDQERWLDTAQTEARHLHGYEIHGRTIDEVTE